MSHINNKNTNTSALSKVVRNKLKRKRIADQSTLKIQTEIWLQSAIKNCFPSVLDVLSWLSTRSGKERPDEDNCVCKRLGRRWRCQDCSVFALFGAQGPHSACCPRRWQECVFPWQENSLLNSPPYIPQKCTQCPSSSCAGNELEAASLPSRPGLALSTGTGQLQPLPHMGSHGQVPGHLLVLCLQAAGTKYIQAAQTLQRTGLCLGQWLLLSVPSQCIVSSCVLPWRISLAMGSSVGVCKQQFIFLRCGFLGCFFV